MRWYWISCEQCGWKAKQPVDEEVKNKFVEVLEVCQDCRKARRPNRRYTVREFITNTGRIL
jgi:ribosome-binding protein aMBF1 (putative translation factor)